VMAARAAALSALCLQCGLAAFVPPPALRHAPCRARSHALQMSSGAASGAEDALPASPAQSASDLPPVKVQLVAQSAISPLSPQTSQEQQQQYSVGVPPPMPPVTFVQRARGPFTAFTLFATATVAAWQSNRLYQARQQSLIADFGATMVAFMDDPREMAYAIKSFRSQLGPGPYRVKMFTAFAKAVASEKTLSVEVIEEFKAAVGLMRISSKGLAEAYGACADDLQSQPSVLGKLLFIAKRSTPEAASQAGLADRFPSWSSETVSALQQAMLDTLYRQMCAELDAGDAPPAGFQTLGLSESDATRIMDDVQAQKATEAEEKELEDEEAARAELLRKAMQESAAASEPRAEEPTTAVDEPSRADGTHEYECSKCGYTLFPAKGREGKFFGADFCCPEPGCDAGRDDFRDLGVA